MRPALNTAETPVPREEKTRGHTINTCFLTDGRKSFRLTLLHQNYLLVHSIWMLQAALGHCVLNGDA